MHVDLHTHSAFSFDAPSTSTASAMCEAAIAKGITHLAITDHCDLTPDTPREFTLLDATFEGLQAAKAEYADRLALLVGIELGQANHHPSLAREILNRHSYDFVLGSIHNLRDVEDFYYMDFSSMPQDEINALFARAVDETAALCDIEGIHSIAHITYIHRYLCRDGRSIDFSAFKRPLTALFQKMVTRGIALEVNTSTLPTIGITLPERELLLLYRECGGRLLSVGSDAHTPEKIAAGFDALGARLRSCGFDELITPTKSGLITQRIG